MAISYNITCVIITDDRDSNRAPLVLSAGATSAEVEAAAAAYLDLPREPNFDAFGLWLLTNPAVSAAYDLAFAGNKLTAGTLQPAVLAAAAGDTSYLRAVLLLLRRQGLLDDALLQAMATKAAECYLPAEFIQALGG